MERPLLDVNIIVHFCISIKRRVAVTVTELEEVNSTAGEVRDYSRVRVPLTAYVRVRPAQSVAYHWCIRRSNLLAYVGHLAYCHNLCSASFPHVIRQHIIE